MKALWREAFGHFFKGWRHHTGSLLATYIVLVASFTAVIGISVLSQNLYKVLTLWGESIQMSVYLADEQSEGQMTQLEKFLKADPRIDKLKFVNQTEALRLFQEQMESYAPDLLADQDLQKMIPSSYQFSIHASIGPERHLSVMQTLAEEIKAFAGVDEVSYGQEWIKSYASITQGLMGLGGFFTLIILAGAAFVVSNVISSSINQRRSEIEVLELIGATRSFIRGPYVIEGFLAGLVASLFALVLSYSLFLTLKGVMKSHLALLQLSNHVQFAGGLWIVGFILLCGLMGALSAYFCVRRINDGYASLRTHRA